MRQNIKKNRSKVAGSLVVLQGKRIKEKNARGRLLKEAEDL